MPDENTLEIQMRARTRQFERDLKRGREIQKRAIEKTRKQVDRANRSMETSARRHTQRMQGIMQRLPVARLAAMATAALSVGSAFRTMYAQIDRVDALVKLSRNLDVSFRSLQGLQRGFDLAGVSSQLFERAITRFNTATGAALAGDAAYVGAFDALRVSLRDAQGEVRSTEDLLFSLADAVQASGLSASQLSDIFKDLFGSRAGTLLVSIFRQGGEALRGMITDASRLGLVVDDGIAKQMERLKDVQADINREIETAATQATAAWADELELVLRKLGLIKSSFFGLVRDARKLAPTESGADLVEQRNSLRQGGIRGWASQFDMIDVISIALGAIPVAGVGGAIGRFALRGMAARKAEKLVPKGGPDRHFGRPQQVEQAMQGLISRYTKEGLISGGIIGGGAVLALADLIPYLKDDGEQLEEINKRLERLIQQGAGPNVGEQTAEMERRTRYLREHFDKGFPSVTQGALGGPSGLGGARDLSAGATMQYNAMQALAPGGVLSPPSTQPQVPDRSAQYREQFEHVRDGFADFDLALEELTAKAEEAAEALESARKAAVKRVNDVIDVNFESALDSLIDGTKSAKEAFADMARSIIIELTKMIAKQLLFNALAAMFSGGATGMGTGPLGGQGFSIGKALGIGDFLGGLFAHGGDTMTGKPIVVGEQGPELFFPGSRGRVLSKAQAQQALTGERDNGVTVVQNMNFALGVQDTVRAEIENLRPQLAEDAKRGVQDAANRGQLNLRPAY